MRGGCVSRNPLSEPSADKNIFLSRVLDLLLWRRKADPSPEECHEGEGYMFGYVCVYIYTHMDTCVYIYIYVYVCTSMYAYTSVRRGREGTEKQQRFLKDTYTVVQPPAVRLSLATHLLQDKAALCQGVST